MNNNIKILVIGNNNDARLIQESLKIADRQFDMTNESSLELALKSLNKNAFDSIILDTNLLNKGGLEILKNIARKFPELPIVTLLTETKNKDIATGALQIQDYILMEDIKKETGGDIISRSIKYAIELKKVNDALKESERRYKHITETILEELWIIDKEGNTSYVSDGMAQRLGYTANEIISHPFINFIDPIDKDKAKQFFELRKQDTKIKYDFNFIKKDGSTACLIISANSIFDKGQFIGSIGLFADITEYRKIIDDLQKSEEFNRRIIESSNDCIKILDIDGRLISMNKGGQKLLEIDDINRHLNTDWTDFWKENDKEKAIIAIETAKKGYIGRFQGYCSTEKGKLRWWDVIITPLTDASNNITNLLSISRDITDIKKIEDKLRKSETDLKKAQELGKIGSWEFDITTQKIYWSDEVYILYERDKKLGPPTVNEEEKYYPPEVAKKLHELAESATKNGKEYIYDATIILPSGKIAFFSTFIHPIKDENNNTIRLLGIIQDVTDRKQIENRLRKSEDNLKRAQRVAHVGNWEWDIITGKITWSEETFHLHGIDSNQQEPTYEELLKYYHQEDRPNFERAVENAVTNGTPYTVVCRVTLPNGSVRYIEGRGEVTYDNKGNIIKLFGTSMDITEHNRTEQTLRVHGEIINNMTEGVCLIRLKDRKIIYTNPKFEKIFGYETGEMIGKDIIIINDPTEKSPEETAKEIIDISKITGIWHGEVRNIKKDGTRFWCYASCSLFDHIEHGKIMVTIIIDITERKNIEEKLFDIYKNLERSNNELEQFAYVASHDLQEPLRTIYGYAELLESNYKGKLDTDADDFIAYITTGAKRMQQMINDLLAFSRITTKGKDFVPVNTERILRIILENLRSLIDKNQAIITYDPLPTIIADDSQIIQLFQNLIENAIKFRREEIPKIHISYKKQYNDHIFSIKDNGIGIDENQFKKLFIIFQRLHSREEYPGTGIGLAMCKKIVERHGGKIWVASKLGIGSTFYFTIPVRPTINNIAN